MANDAPLPRPPSGSLFAWITRMPHELLAYLRFVYALRRLTLNQGAQKFTLKVAEENAVLEAAEGATAEPSEPPPPAPGGTDFLVVQIFS